MADIIEFAQNPIAKQYSVDVTEYPDTIAFTVNGIKVNPQSLRQIADQLEKIVQIIRTDVVTGAV